MSEVQVYASDSENQQLLIAMRSLGPAQTAHAGCFIICLIPEAFRILEAGPYRHGQSSETARLPRLSRKLAAIVSAMLTVAS